MNLVGKIFTVLIFVMSLVFMSFAVAVYATHKNWRDTVMRPPAEAGRGQEVGLQHQLENAKARNTELKDRLDQLEGALAAEKAAKRQALSKLETENEELKRERDQTEKEHAKLVQSQREAVAAMQATQETLTALRKEVDTLRADIRTAQSSRDDHFKQVVDLTDQLHQAVNEYKRLKARQVTLVADLAKCKELLRVHEISLEGDETPPRVDGLVLATPGAGLIEVSIGADDGLRKGHTLEVYRIAGGQSTYLGRVVVMKTSPDKSVCKVDPNFRRGTIQKGDRVASKFD